LSSGDFVDSLPSVANLMAEIYGGVRGQMLKALLLKAFRVLEIVAKYAIKGQVRFVGRNE
jgi:hypothetical protein